MIDRFQEPDLDPNWGDDGELFCECGAVHGEEELASDKCSACGCVIDGEPDDDREEIDRHH